MGIDRGERGYIYGELSWTCLADRPGSGVSYMGFSGQSLAVRRQSRRYHRPRRRTARVVSRGLHVRWPADACRCRTSITLSIGEESCPPCTPLVVACAQRCMFGNIWGMCVFVEAEMIVAGEGAWGMALRRGWAK